MDEEKEQSLSLFDRVKHESLPNQVLELWNFGDKLQKQVEELQNLVDALTKEFKPPKK